MSVVLSEGGHEPVVSKDVAEESEEAAPPYPLMVRSDAPQRAQEVRERQGHRYCRPHAAGGWGKTNGKRCHGKWWAGGAGPQDWLGCARPPLQPYRAKYIEAKIIVKRPTLSRVQLRNVKSEKTLKEHLGPKTHGVILGFSTFKQLQFTDQLSEPFGQVSGIWQSKRSKKRGAICEILSRGLGQSE